VGSSGANDLLILPGPVASGDVPYNISSGMTLTPEDANATLQRCSAVRATAPVIQAGLQVEYGQRNRLPLYVYGTTPTFLEVREWRELQEGQAFSEKDVQEGNFVCLLGQTLVHELFQGESPLGREILIQDAPFRVTGVLSRKGVDVMGRDQDDIVLVPWTAIKYRLAGLPVSGSNPSSSVPLSILYPPQHLPRGINARLSGAFTHVDQIIAAASSSSHISEAIQQISKVLRERHRIRDGEPDDFVVRDMTEVTGVLSLATKLIVNLLICIALVVLVIGGIGILDIVM